MSINLGAMFGLVRSAMPRPPNSGDRSIVMTERGVLAIAAFETPNRTITSMAKLEYSSDCKSSPCGKFAKEL